VPIVFAQWFSRWHTLLKLTLLFDKFINYVSIVTSNCGGTVEDFYILIFDGSEISAFVSVKRLNCFDL